MVLHFQAPATFFLVSNMNSKETMLKFHENLEFLLCEEV